jgi:hypothetical protein
MMFLKLPFLLCLAKVIAASLLCAQPEELVRVNTTRIWSCGPLFPQVSFKLEASFQIAHPSPHSGDYMFFIGLHSDSNKCNEASWILVWQNTYNGSETQTRYVDELILVPQPHRQFCVFYGYKNMNHWNPTMEVEIWQWYIRVEG